MNRIILTGLRDLATDEFIKSQRDYGLFITASRVSQEEMDDEPGCFKYRLKMDHVDSIFDLKEKKDVGFEKGKSPSQKMRFRIINLLGEEEYENFMSYLMGRLDGISEDYLDNLKK
jgi:hypothetical protein